MWNFVYFLSQVATGHLLPWLRWQLLPPFQAEITRSQLLVVRGSNNSHKVSDDLRKFSNYAGMVWCHFAGSNGTLLYTVLNVFGCFLLKWLLVFIHSCCHKMSKFVFFSLQTSQVPCKHVYTNVCMVEFLLNTCLFQNFKILQLLTKVCCT